VVLEGYIVCEIFDKEDAPAVYFRFIFWQCGVGYAGGVEASAFVFDAKAELFFGGMETKCDLLLDVTFVAMNYGVCDGFYYCKVNIPEEAIVDFEVPTESFDKIFNHMNMLQRGGDLDNFFCHTH